MSTLVLAAVKQAAMFRIDQRAITGAIVGRTNGDQGAVVTFTLTEQARRATPQDLLRSVAEGVSALRHRGVAGQVSDVLSRLAAALLGRDLAGRPGFVLTESDDDSAAMEWRFPDRRLAFTLEPNAEESGWHFVSLPKSGGALENGSFEELRLNDLMNRMLGPR